jgi:ATP synthase protein I
MTTATPGFRTTSVAPGVRGAALAVLVVGLAATIAAAVFATSAAVLGAAIGAALVLFFFGFGALTVNFVAGRLPSAALLVAVLTYTLQVVLLAVVFVALTSSGATDNDVDPNWLGLTVIACTLTWIGAQIVGATRARIPAYDLPEDAPGSAGQPGGGDAR